MTVPGNPYPALARAVDPVVLRSIRQASQTTSTDFGLLMAQAARESGFRSDAKSPTSSAAGLFQFVDSTWLDMVHRFGDKYGIGDLAQQISQTSSGKLVVANPAMRQKILDLRADPTLSAELAAEYAKQNQAELQQALGRPLTRGDLYMAHFLGAGGAAAFLKALDSKGNAVAATLLPDAAAANPAIFYDGARHAKTVSEIYESVAARIETDASVFAGDAKGTMSLAAGMNAGTGFTNASPYEASSLGRSLNWSGVKLSAPMLEMLNIVALAALKMADDLPAEAAATPKPVPLAPRTI